MASSRPNSFLRVRRHWSFADCIFDEANWTLIVGGRRVAIETKPLELLRELLLHAGNVVTKDELLDAIWPDVVVVEASLPTAVGKLRRALNDDRRKVPVIETVPRIGYRLGVPAEVEELSGEPMMMPPANDHQVQLDGSADEPASRASAKRDLGRLYVASGLTIVAAVFAFAFAPTQNVSATKAAPQFSQREVEDAIRDLDLGAVKRLIAAGWDPNAQWDKSGGDAMTMLLNHCEWDPDHDRRKMLLVARTLIDGGAEIDRRNIFGDTAYSIAKAPRYCGPDHPVTQMLEAMCYRGDMGPKDLCLATYELTAEQRRAQGLPPKG